MRRPIALATLLALSAVATTALARGPNKVTVYRDARGHKLRVDGKDMMVFGMNWAYMPIGQNYNYSLWRKSDAFIKEALHPEMKLLKRMGVNVVRQYVGVPPRWIKYIYEKYGIFTVLNHSVGRYGFNIDGTWVAQTNYADKRTRELITQDVLKLIPQYKNTPGLLMWLLGNENNYGLDWADAAVADLPAGDGHKYKAKFLYSLFGEIIRGIKKLDTNHPVSIANGDLQYIDLIAKHCKGLDVLGSNVYRGASSGKLFDDVKKKLGIPFMYTEFGADAYNSKEQREDHIAQAKYLKSLWQEIYEHSYGKGRAGNAIGGMTFQWSDGWWKTGQTVRLDQHDTAANWANKAYPHDYVKGQNNMNEEWFGICAKGPNNARGLHRVTPRTAYYVLQAGCKLDPYAPSTTLAVVRKHWGSIDVRSLSHKYKAESALAKVAKLSRIKLTNIRMEFSTFTTGGKNLDAPNRARMDTRFDHMQSFFFGMEARPTNNIRATMAVNIVGNVADNPINEIFFERRARPTTVRGQTDIDPNPVDQVLDGAERVKLYSASIEWDESWFNLKGFYRVGHYHWGYEGDFFGMYQSAYYGPNLDLYNANVPIGIELTGKRWFKGLKIAFGPEIYWGANPTIIAKYENKIPGTNVKFAVMHQEDIAQRAGGAVSVVIPQPKTRRTSLYLAKKWGPVKVEVGGLMAGSTLVDRPFVRAEETAAGGGYLNSGYNIADDKVRMIDTLAAKAKVTASFGRFNFLLQGAYRGIVADAGGDETLTFTGWTLKESGRGNHYHVRAGATMAIGDLQIAPNFLYQRPLTNPLPNIEDGFDSASGTYFAGVQARNILSDPFVVRGNQEMLGYELLLVWDPTPATFFWAFDNIKREDALLAGSLDFVYRNYRQGQDANIGVFASGGLFAFSSAPPAEDLWEVRLKLISNPFGSLRVLLEGYAGRGQSRGDDVRLVDRFGVNLRATWGRWDVRGFLRIHDWGPFDFHQDFNLTFPLQLMGDISYGATLPKWFTQTYTRIGVRGQMRTLDENSPRYNTATPGGALGNEWEVLTYLHVAM
jgi:beta-galactosidase